MKNYKRGIVMGDFLKTSAKAIIITTLLSGSLLASVYGFYGYYTTADLLRNERASSQQLENKDICLPDPDNGNKVISFFDTKGTTSKIDDEIQFKLICPTGIGTNKFAAAFLK